MNNDLRRLEAALNGSIAGLSSSQTQATTEAHPEKWSIQQIAEHLLRTYQLSIPAIRIRVEKRSVTRAIPSLRQRLGQFFIIKLGHFPGGWEAPAAVSPSRPLTVQSGDELVVKISRELAELDRLTAQGEAILGTRRAVSHMLLGPLSMQQWRRFHLIHGLHHVKQINAIRRDHRF